MSNILPTEDEIIELLDAAFEEQKHSGAVDALGWYDRYDPPDMACIDGDVNLRELARKIMRKYDDALAREAS